MNETKPNIYQLHAMLDDLRRLHRAVRKRGNDLVVVTESLDDMIFDLSVNWVRS